MQGEFVLGFAFDLQHRVALICKERPDWQKGKWNGIGGRIEPTELPHAAMRREFREETGAQTIQWSHAGTMRGQCWAVYVFKTRGVSAEDVRTTTDEEVRWFHERDVYTNKRLLPNVAALVALCCVAPDHAHKIPQFELVYT